MIETMRIGTESGETTNMILESRFVVRSGQNVAVHRVTIHGERITDDMSSQEAVRWIKDRKLVIAPGTDRPIVQFSSEFMRVLFEDSGRQQFFRLLGGPLTTHHQIGPVYEAKNGTRWQTAVSPNAVGYAWKV